MQARPLASLGLVGDGDTAIWETIRRSVAQTACGAIDRETRFFD